jgi:hypothetical protein
MIPQIIDGDMRVWTVIQEHPETYDVFRNFGCPDMRKGIFALSAHIMKVSWAARVHHIELDRLLADLNQAVSEHHLETPVHH